MMAPHCMNLINILFLLHLLGLRSVIGYRNFQSDDPQRMAEMISETSNEFGFAFLNETSSSQNTFVSTISISMITGLLYSGANGTSAEEIQNVMKFPCNVHLGFKRILDAIKPPEGLKTSQPTYSLEMANAILVDKYFNIRPVFKDDSRYFYEAAVESIRFSLYPKEAEESVNGWVAWRTKNKITNLLKEPLEPLTKLFLMNAVYFKGTWETKFDQRFTMPDTFYNQGLVPKTVPMMRKKEKQRYTFDRRLQTHILELPYSGDEIAMLLLLPEKRDGLSEIEPHLSNEILTKISSNLKEVLVQITLPRFNLNEEYDLVPILKKMGISEVFNSNTSDLTGISPKQGLYVTKAIHKCVVEVNEEGAVAAAVTGVSAGVRTGGPLVPHFIADHPFMFFIRHTKLNLILFVGRVSTL